MRRRRDVHLERHRRSVGAATKLFASGSRALLRQDLILALSLALAALYVRALLQERSRPRSNRQVVPVRGDGCDLVSVVAICRAAVSCAHIGADATRGVWDCRSFKSFASRRGYARRGAEPYNFGCRPCGAWA